MADFKVKSHSMDSNARCTIVIHSSEGDEVTVSTKQCEHDWVVGGELSISIRPKPIEPEEVT
jgi:hypothetical protein